MQLAIWVCFVSAYVHTFELNGKIVGGSEPKEKKMSRNPWKQGNRDPNLFWTWKNKSKFRFGLNFGDGLRTNFFLPHCLKNKNNEEKTVNMTNANICLIHKIHIRNSSSFDFCCFSLFVCLSRLLYFLFGFFFNVIHFLGKLLTDSHSSHTIESGNWVENTQKFSNWCELRLELLFLLKSAHTLRRGIW